MKLTNQAAACRLEETNFKNRDQKQKRFTENSVNP
jgi:hypothetical protein